MFCRSTSIIYYRPHRQKRGGKRGQPKEGSFTLDEIKAALATMPCGKIDFYEVPMELLKIGMVEELLFPIILNDMDTSNKEAPAKMLLSQLIPIFENKGSASDANDYRGITLLIYCEYFAN